MKRRLFLASSIAAALGGCAPIGTVLNDNPGFHHLLGLEGALDAAILGDSSGLARRYSVADISPHFPVDSLPTPTSSTYEALLASGFRSYALAISGAVERPMRIPLARLAGMAQQTQITRHDCVEGWSAIGAWTGVPLRNVLRLAMPHRDARYVVFRCMDRDDQGTPYYESLDMAQAYHPQTLLALQLNGRPIRPDHGAPVRLRVPTQLGYKSAKWVAEIQVVGSFAHLYGGKGGYWEDQGYEWYAGI